MVEVDVRDMRAARWVCFSIRTGNRRATSDPGVAMNNVNQATKAGAFTTVPGTGAFWSLSALVWCVYAASLMVPWIGRYPIPDMLPNKLTIALTGVAVSGGLAALYKWMEGRSVPRAWFFVVAPTACVAGAVTFDAIVIAVTQGPSALLDRWTAGGTFGSILGGVPMSGRIGQYTTLLIAWSLGWHLFARRGIERAAATTTVTVPEFSEGALSVSGTTVRARDGHRTVILDRDEIDWIAADGDYIRIYTGAKNLLVRATMKHAIAVLGALGFARVHRSAIVNPRRVREIVRDGNGDSHVLLRNGVRVRVGRNYASQVAALLALASSGPVEPAS